MQTILDAGPLVALLDPRDAHHAWAFATARSLDVPLLTCEAVVTEAHFLLRRRTHDGSHRLNILLRSGQIDVSFRLSDHLEAVSALMAQYANIPMSFADACLVQLSEGTGAQVFTTDGGFQTFRALSGRRIPLLLPLPAARR